MKYKPLLLSALSTVALAQQEDCAADSTYPPSADAGSILKRDVCIVGGGSAGIYSAVRLRELGKSVVVIESSERLGGHCEVYTDPVTGGTIDAGVVVFHNTSLVRDYFGRFNISLFGAPIDAAASAASTLPIDFKLGVSVPVDASSVAAGLAAGFAGYGAQLAQYPYLESGFDLPYPVPEDLLLPFQGFLEKHNLTNPAFVQFVYTFAQGLGDILELPTIYILSNFHSYILQALGSVGDAAFLTNGPGGCQLLYTAAGASLGEDILLSSHVASMDRDASDSYASVVIQTADGSSIDAQCGKILVAAPPTPEALPGFDLSVNETELFSQFTGYSYHTTVIRNSGIPANTSASNIAFDQPYFIPALPSPYNILQSGIPDLISLKYISNSSVTREFVEQDILTTLPRLQIAGKNTTAEPEIVFYSNHARFELHVGSQAIRDGFYAKLYDLQGERKTFYTGAAWHTHDSSYIWKFTEALLPRIIE
ncbi:FAD dependent oxidoreductase [Phlyctema vagabunda]|uniref:FAD dependent oxidoreductase n=1 Tax=Phlyctema vagabunda TaxID=108571 RepID=A0ABR4PTA1_9HELO